MRRQSGISRSSDAQRVRAGKVRLGQLRPAALAWSVAIAFAGAPLALQANPTGGVAVQGSATFANSGSTLTVTTQNGAGSNNSAINWQSFSIPQGSTTNFVQPNAASTVINRVVTNTPSQIFGTLSSNGKLVLVNQSGITVGAGAVVDTAGFTASVLGMSDADAAAGRMRFAADNLGSATGKLQVDGKIIARTGDVVLIAPSVELAKTAVVEAPNGAAILVAGQKVEVTGRGLEGIRLEVQAPTDSAVNLGTLKGDAVGIFATSLRHSGLIQATGVTVSGGRVVLKATDTAQVDGRIEATKVVSTPSGPQTVGGDVSIEGRIVTLSGAVQATGVTGGNVDVTGYSVSQSGTINASGTSQGGKVRLVAENYVEQVWASKVDVSSANGQGGSVLVQATGDQGEVLTSGNIVADGATGGTVEVYAPTVYLQAARISADGTSATAGDGGSIYLGGGKQGDDPLKPNSRYLVINSATTLSARSRRKGQGGTIILWSDGTTRYSGTANARGGEDGGDGGFIEVSGKESVVFRGMADAGATHGHGGTLLLDPKNITIEAGGSTAQSLDPDPETVGDGQFGSTMELWGGKLVITDPSNDSNATNAGAVYVFDPATGALLGALRGSHANDAVGQNIGLNPINNNELLLLNSTWNSNTGAITLYSLSSPITGIVDSSNSFVGSTSGDYVGNYGYTIIYGAGGVRELVLGSPSWNSDRGAVIKISSTGGVRSGVVSSSTALVGAAAGDRLGDFGNTNRIVTSYNNNTFLLLTSAWNNGRGAVTRGVVGSALTGVIGASNSLVGTSTTDAIGIGGAILNGDGSYVVFSPNFNGNSGAVTWAGSSGVTGTLDTTAVTGNTLTGSAGSYYGFNHELLDNNKFVVLAPTWSDDVGTPNKGAFTVLDRATKLPGTVSAANSVVGSNANDYVSCDYTASCDYRAGALQSYGDSWYSVGSAKWDNEHGAVTFFYTGGSTSFANTAAVKTPKGVISGSSATNLSVVGSWGTGEAASGSDGDRVGAAGNGNRPDYNPDGFGQFAVFTPSYDNGRGAVMLLDVTSMATSLTLNDSNSVTGTVNWTDAGYVMSSYADQIGSGQWINNHYLIANSEWGYGRGLVASISMGQTGALNSSNALVGTIGRDIDIYNPDLLGSGLIQVLGNGQVLVSSPNWASSTGAVTIVDPGAGFSGTIGSGNSMIGQTPGDKFGPTDWRQVLDLSYQDTVVVASPEWSSNRGAITWISLSSPNGTVDQATNSLVGASSGDRVGSGGFVGAGSSYGTFLPYAMALSPYFDTFGEGSRGAITKITSTATPGVVSSSNSLVGASYGDAITINCYDSTNCSNAYWFNNNAWILQSSINNGNDYAFTVFAPGVAPLGTVDASNSIIESQSTNATLYTDNNGYGNGLNDKAVLFMPLWGGDKGAIRVIDTNSSATGATSSSNALVGNSGDYLGSDGGESTFVYAHAGGRMIVFSPHWNGNFGAVTVLDTQGSPYTGTLSSSNSLVGTSVDDFGGSSAAYEGLQYRGLGNDNFVVMNRFYGGGQGALTYFDLGAIPTGDISTSNSLLGGAGNTISGYNAFYVNGGTDIVITAPSWNNNRGFAALFTANSTSRPVGNVDSTNALIGVNDGDQIGDRVFDIGSGNFIVGSQNWGGGEGSSRGAITWGNVSSPLTGVVDATTSLVGAHDYDYLGAGFGEGGYDSPVGRLGSTSTYYVLDRDYNNGFGAIAFVEFGATGSFNNQTVIASAASGGIDYYSYYNTPLDLGTGWYAVRMYGGVGQVYFTQAIPGGSLGGAPLPQDFATGNPGDDVTITTGTIKAITDTGTGIVLQANNNININGDINTVGSLTFEAGNSIDINANITNTGGVTFIANSMNANSSYRDSGPGQITVEAGKTVNYGSGTATFRVDSGESAGDIYIYGTVTGSGTLNVTTPNWVNVYGYDGPARLQGGNVNIDAYALDVYGGSYGATVLATGDLNVTANSVYVSSGSSSGYAQIVVAGNAHFNVWNNIEVSTNGEGSGGTATIAVLGNMLMDGGEGTSLNINGGTGGTARVTAGSFDFTGGEAILSGGSGGTARLDVAGAMHMNLLGNFEIGANSGTAAVTAGSADITAYSMGVYAGYGTATLDVTGAMNISVSDYLAINGGYGTGAYASMKSGGSAVISANVISISGGSGDGAYGLLDPTQPGSTMTITANDIYLDGGEGAGSYAALVSQGGNMNFVTPLPTLHFNPGTGAGADAVIYAPNGEELAALFGLPYLGDENPLPNGVTQFGFAKYKLPINYEQNDLLSGLDWLNGLLNPEDRRRRRGDDIVFEICAR